MADKYKRLGTNTLLVFLGGAGSKLITLIMLPLYTRWLSPEEFGTTDIITTYAMIVMGVLSMSIADAVFVVPSGAGEEELKGYYTSGWKFIVSVFGIVAITCVCAKVLFSQFNSCFIMNYLWLIYLVAFSACIQQYIQSFTKTINKMVVYSLCGVVNTACVAGFAFLFIPSYGIKGYILSVVFAHFAAALYAFIASKSYKYLFFIVKNSIYLKDLLKYGAPLVPNGIMFWFVNGMNRPLIANYIGLDANGILAVANKLPAIISSLFVVFANAWTISIIEEYGKKDFVRFFEISLRCVLLPSVLASCVIAMFSEEIVGIIATEDFFEAYKYVPIAILGSLLSGLSGIVGAVFAAKKQSKYFFYSSFWGAATSLVMMFLLIPTLKLYGATIAVCLSFAAMVLVRYLFAKNDLKGMSLKSVFNMLFGYCIVAIVVPIEMPRLYKIMVSLTVVLLIIWLNRDIFSVIVAKIRKK